MAALPKTTDSGAAPETQSLPGPTGESNRLTTAPRPPLLCAGPGAEAARAQAEAVRAMGGIALEANGQPTESLLTGDQEISGVLWWGDDASARKIEQALARRNGAIIPLIPGLPDRARVMAERHVCVDTTAAGGNAALLGGKT